MKRTYIGVSLATVMAIAAMVLASCSALAQQGQCPQYSAAAKVHSAGETAYTLAPKDQCALLVFKNTGAEVVTMPAPGAHFPAGWMVSMFASGSGGITLTPPVGVNINGTTSLAKAQNAGASCYTEDVAWWCKP